MSALEMKNYRKILQILYEAQQNNKNLNKETVYKSEKHVALLSIIDDLSRMLKKVDRASGSK